MMFYELNPVERRLYETLLMVQNFLTRATKLSRPNYQILMTEIRDAIHFVEDVMYGIPSGNYQHRSHASDVIQKHKKARNRWKSTK